MKLAQLLSIYPQLKWGESANLDIYSICDDSRDVQKGSVFVAISGSQIDGHKYIASAIEKGAIAIVIEKKVEVPESYKGAVVLVENTRVALNELASRYYNEPFRDLFCIGVTGTNGKTSTTYMLESILTEFGWLSGVMGTIDHHVGEKSWKSNLTTPGSLLLHRRMREFVSMGARASIFEVSSHALSQKRVDAIPFNVAIFTNLTRDHLDYHNSMDEYFKAKQYLFKELPLLQANQKLVAIINRDDDYGQKMEFADSVKVFSYGKCNCDFSFSISESAFSGTRFLLNSPRGRAEGFIPLPGEHNVYNAVAAVAGSMVAGVSLETALSALKKFKGVPGRLQRVENNKGLHVFIDYAHTDQALETVLRGLRLVGERQGGDYKIITVFGCGGDRDHGKRPLMMAAAKKHSDLVFLTSDNPRTEDPLKIIEEALTVVSEQELDHTIFVEPDRKLAITRAISMAKEGDVILVAGKGHENYQIIGKEIIPFSDADVIKDYFKGSQR